MIQLFRYQRADRSEPFTNWLRGLRDKAVQAKVRIRLQRVASGHLGDIKPVGSGVSELRIHIGPGYRIYLGQHGNSWIILLCGGDKSSQQRDIQLAKQYWQEWKEKQP